MIPFDHEEFARAFDGRSSGCRRQCECGVTYYDNSYQGGWTWEDGELEALEADPKAIAVGHSVGEVRFNEKCYVPECKCWHADADRVHKFLFSHRHSIAKLYELQKFKLEMLAKSMPDVYFGP